jgi:uncharacterized membrane protein
MTKARLEAFSDGVFAIVITLLILDVRLPQVPYEQLPSALAAAGPQLVAYVLSFLLIGLYWIFHHQGLHRLERIDSVFLWINLLFLLCVSFLPFPTTLLGRYPLKTWPMVLYGSSLLAANGMGFLMLLYTHRKKSELIAAKYRESTFRQQWPIYAIVNGAYVVAIGAAFVAPIASEIIYGAVILGVVARTLHERL